MLAFTFTFSHLVDAFIQRDLQMRTIEAIKRAMIIYVNVLVFENLKTQEYMFSAIVRLDSIS